MSMTGQELVEYGCCWISRNYDTFNKIAHLIHIEADNGNPSVQQGDILILAKKRGLDIGEYPGIKRDRNLWPIITRYCVMRRPKLARVLSFRKSKADKVDMVAAWHEYVDANTFFLAKDWKEAQHLVEIGDVSAS